MRYSLYLYIIIHPHRCLSISRSCSKSQDHDDGVADGSISDAVVAELEASMYGLQVQLSHALNLFLSKIAI